MPPIYEFLVETQKPNISKEELDRLDVIRLLRVKAYNIMDSLVPDSGKDYLIHRKMKSEAAQYTFEGDTHEEIPENVHMTAWVARIMGQDRIVLLTQKVEVSSGENRPMEHPRIRAIASERDITYIVDEGEDLNNSHQPTKTPEDFEYRLTLDQQEEAIDRILDTLDLISEAQTKAIALEASRKHAKNPAKPQHQYAAVHPQVTQPYDSREEPSHEDLEEPSDEHVEDDQPLDSEQQPARPPENRMD